VIDRLSFDLRDAYPDLRRLSPMNLLLMRSFAAANPDAHIVKQQAEILDFKQQSVSDDSLP
jgi:hypothetical protein